MSDVQPALQEIFRTVFDDDELTVTDTTTAADIDGWDSMAHINLIIAIEKQFGVSFSAAEIAALGKRGQNVGSIAQLLAAKQAAG
jgi:acyl carrier protein